MAAIIIIQIIEQLFLLEEQLHELQPQPQSFNESEMLQHPGGSRSEG